MAATMPNPDDNHQSLNQEGERSFQEPSWVKPVKTASVVMGVMIVFCLALLGYGLSTNMGKLAESSGKTYDFTYPKGMDLHTSSMNADGYITLVFKKDDGGFYVATINPKSQKIITSINLNPGQAWGCEDKD